MTENESSALPIFQGLVVGIFLMGMLNLLFNGGKLDCANGALNGYNIVWSQSYPNKCKVEAVVEGKTKLLEIDDYEKYLELIGDRK
jgi:hypothetical protein